MECECFEVVSGSHHYFFDRVDCALQALDMRCEHCDERIYGEAVDNDGRSYCSTMCASLETDLKLPVGVERGRAVRSVPGPLVLQHN
jgi:hypothetical protein